ncbi:hypothetical protein GCM10009678_35740 [Actinomadura kijaniata]
MDQLGSIVTYAATAVCNDRGHPGVRCAGVAPPGPIWRAVPPVAPPVEPTGVVPYLAVVHTENTVIVIVRVGSGGRSVLQCSALVGRGPHGHRATRSEITVAPGTRERGER